MTDGSTVILGIEVPSSDPIFLAHEGRGTEGFDRAEEVEVGYEYAELTQVLKFQIVRPSRFPRSSYRWRSSRHHAQPWPGC